MTKRALLVTAFPWAGMSTPVKNTAAYLTDHGWDVTLVTIGDDTERFPFPEEVSRKTTIVRLSRLRKNPFLILLLSYKLLMIRRGKPLCFLFDHQALFHAFLIILIGRKNSCVYYSLEFYEPTHNLRATFKALERLLSVRCAGVITQHQTRAEYMCSERIGRRHWIVPNSPRGAYLGALGNQIERRFQNPSLKIKLLCIGTLSSDTLVDELLVWFSKNTPNVELVLHGWFVSQDIELLAYEVLKIKKTDMTISTQFVDDNLKWDVYAEVDIVFVGYRNSCKNLRLAAGSAGKLYDAIRAGKPILAIDSTSMRDIVDGFRIGVVVHSISDLARGVSEIKKNYKTFSQNCEAAYAYFSHDRLFSLMLQGHVNNLEAECTESL